MFWPYWSVMMRISESMGSKAGGCRWALKFWRSAFETTWEPPRAAAAREWRSEPYQGVTAGGTTPA